MIRWMKWIVRAKSGTSLERETKRRMKMTLLEFVSPQKYRAANSPKPTGKGWRL